MGDLRPWNEVVPVAAPAGVATTTRMVLRDRDRVVLDAVAGLIGPLRRADLRLACSSKDSRAKEEVARRKREMTAATSSRWAGSIVRANRDQVRLSKDAQQAHIDQLQAAINTIETRLELPTGDTADGRERRRGDGKGPRGYATQRERFEKQRRLQHLKATLGRVQADRKAGVVHVVAGTKALLKNRLHPDTAGLTEQGWREEWDAARWTFAANGSPDEPHGNLTITVEPDGRTSIRLPVALEHLANAPRGRYVLDAKAVFKYRGDEWQQQMQTGAVSYEFRRVPGRKGVYLTASWGTKPNADAAAGIPERLEGSAIGVDLNDGFLAVRRLDRFGNPVGRRIRIPVDIYGSSDRTDAQVRHAITRLIHAARRFGLTQIAVENLNFTDARETGRETMGRGQRGKQFRNTVSNLPTAVFRDRLTAMAARAGIQVWAVNPAYTSKWGDQHWRKPYRNVDRHDAAATVIGRRAQGHRARRREGVTRPDQRIEAPAATRTVVRATNQTRPHSPARASRQATGGRTRGHQAHPKPATERKRTSNGRATVTPAGPANNGQLQQ